MPKNKVWRMKAAKAVTAKEAKLAAEYRMHNRHGELTKAIESLRDKFYAEPASGEAERKFSVELCELEIELAAVEGALIASESVTL